MVRKRVWIWTCGILLVGAAHAQDLSWTELETITEPPQPASEVKMSGRRLPGVPKEIVKLSEIAYAEVTFVTDAKGEGLVRAPVATSPWLLPAVDEGLSGYKIKSVERRKGYTPYMGTRCYLIFNPASAGARLAESTPRALVVRSAVFPAEMLKKHGKKNDSAQELPQGIQADVSVDAMGAITDVVPVGLPQSKLTEAVVIALKQWQFAPARRGNTPFATTVRVPVLFRWPDLYNVTDLSKHPRPIKQSRPVYPMSERINRFQGAVTVEFVVTSTGDVREAHVYQSNNPGFNEAALDAVKEWKFEPGYVDGRAVATRMRLPMVFELNGEGSDRYQVSRGKPSKLPPQLQNDYLPRAKNVALGVYPYDELEKGTHATVNFSFVVRPDGKVEFIEPKDQALSAFDYAARAMIEEFEFIPASKDGKPNWGLLKMEVHFESNSEEVPVSSSARSILRELRKKDPAIFKANQIDQKPKTLVSHPPVYPSNLRKDQVQGETLIEFFIDEKGLVQLPHVISATHPSFGYAGAQALSQWTFTPPTHNGKPVIVKVRMPMVFAPGDAKSSDSKPAEEAGAAGSSSVP